MKLPTCPLWGKPCHTKGSAQAAAKFARRTNTGRGVVAYRCPDWEKHPDGAGRYHIGHPPGSRGRPVRGRRRRLPPGRL